MSAEAQVINGPVGPPHPHSEHHCPTCDISWWGPDSCWLCDGEGVSRAALDKDLRLTWAWANQFRPPTEGDPPA